MEQYQLYRLIVVFILNLFLGETYKITAYHEVSVQPLVTSRSIITEDKHGISDSSLRDSSYSTRLSNVEDSSEKQSKGLLNSLLGGGSKGEGGGEEEIGQASGSGGVVGGLQGGIGGELLGGGLLGGGLLGGLPGLLTSILGRARSQISTEELKNKHMLSEFGDDCNEDAALKSPMSDSADTGDSKSISLRKNEDNDETSSGESKSEDRGNLVLESNVLNGNDNPLLRKKSTQCSQCEEDEYAFDGKAFNDANSIADLDTSIVSSRSSINKDSGIPSDSDTESNFEQIGRLRLKRQLGGVGQLVNANISVLDSEKQSGSDNTGDDSSTPTKRRRSIASISQEEETSESVAIKKEMRYKDGLETEGNRLEPVIDKKMSNMDDMDGVKTNLKIGEHVGIQEEDHTENLENGGKSDKIVGSNEMDHTYGRNTGRKTNKNIGSRQMDSEERTEYGDSSSVDVEHKDGDHIDSIETGSKIYENKGSKEIDYVVKVRTGGKSSQNVESKEKNNLLIKQLTNSVEGTESRDMSSGNVEKKEEDQINSIESESKSSKIEGSKEMDYMDRVQTGKKSSVNVGNGGMDNQEETKFGEMSKENKRNKEIDYSGEVESDSKSSENIGSREIDKQKEENHIDDIETESKSSGNLESKEMDDMDTLESGEESNENYVNREMGDRGTGFVVTSNEIENKDKNTVDRNSVGLSVKSSGNEGSNELENKESEAMSSENLDSKDMDNIHTKETGDISSENYGRREIDYKERTESAGMNREHVENKEIGTDNSYSVETIGGNSNNEGSSESENNEARDMNSENVKNKEMSLMDNIESGASGNEGNRELVSKERADSGVISRENEEYKRKGSTNTKEPGETFGSMEVSNTDFIERESSKTSGSKEVDISENSSNTDKIKDSDEFNRSVGLEEIYSSDYVGAKDSSNSVDLNSGDESFDGSNQMIGNKNSFEEDEVSNSAMDDYNGSESTYSTSSIFEDVTHDKDSSSSEEYPNYADYSYFEHDFGLENPESSDSKEEKSDDLSNVENGSKESAENTEKGSRYRYYIPFPYSLKYNFADIYRSAIHGIYKALMYRYHPRSFLFKKRLSNVPFKRTVPSAQAKQLEMPFLNTFSTAGSSWYGSYASAQSSPFLGGGVGLGEEEPGLGEEEEIGEVEKR